MRFSKQLACWEEGEGDSSPALQPQGGAHSLPVGRILAGFGDMVVSIAP